MVSQGVCAQGLIILARPNDESRYEPQDELQPGLPRGLYPGRLLVSHTYSVIIPRQSVDRRSALTVYGRSVGPYCNQGAASEASCFGMPRCYRGPIFGGMDESAFGIDPERQPPLLRTHSLGWGLELGRRRQRER